MNRLEGTSKDELRAFFRNKRKLLSENKTEKKALDLEIEARFLMSEEYRKCDTLLIYISRDDEIDTRGIISAAFSNGKRVAVPRCESDMSLGFYYIDSLSGLEKSSFGILEPDKSAPKVDSFDGALCVCPALCCDMRGYRIGYGKGYYDRFLSGFSGVKVSLCYSEFLIPVLDAESCDEKTDIIVTDRFLRYIADEKEDNR